MTEQTQTRAEAVAARRKQRGAETSSDPSLRRYGMSEDMLDLNKFSYRSVADEGNRLYQLTEQDDYDFVTIKGEKASKADTQGVARYQHTVIDGQPRYTYLLRKPVEFVAEDRKAKDKHIDEMESKRLKQTPDDAPEGAYKPKK